MYQTLLFLHFIGLALGVGTGFAQMTLGIASRDLSPDERPKFFQRTATLGKNSSIGLLLLVLTGLGMTFMRTWPAVLQWGGPAFHAKLTLVVLFIGVFGYLQMLVRRVRREGGGPALATIPKVSRVMLLIAIAIVLCAVIAFQ
jgi:uncharacterized membrane protein